MNELNIRTLCKEGDIDKIKSLIWQEGINSYRKKLIYMFSCYYGHLNIVKYLVEEYGINARCNNDHAVLKASEGGHLNIVKYLIEKCGAINYNDDALIRACEGGHLNIVEYLIEKRGIIDTDYDNLICSSSDYGHLEVIKYLINKYGIDTTNTRAIIYASRNGYLEIVKYLVEKCGVIISDEAMYEAINNEYFEVAKYLKEHGAILMDIFNIFNVKFEKYLDIYYHNNIKRQERASKKIYFWWVQIVYNLNQLYGHRMMRLKYEEYKMLTHTQFDF